MKKLLLIIILLMFETSLKAQIQLDTMLTSATGVLPTGTTAVPINNYYNLIISTKTPACVYDGNKLVANIDTNGILTVFDSLATIKSIFNSYGYKIKGYMKKYYYTYEYFSDGFFIKGMNFMFSTTKPIEKQLKDEVCKMLNKDIDKNKLTVSNMDDNWLQ